MADADLSDLEDYEVQAEYNRHNHAAAASKERADMYMAELNRRYYAMVASERAPKQASDKEQG